jgi:hypothetical protein
MASSKYSAVIKKSEDEELKRIDEVSNNTNTLGSNTKK